MNRSPGDWCAQTSEIGHSGTVVSQSCLLEDVSFGAFADATETQTIQWATPDGFEMVGQGIAAEFSTTGPNRFDEIRSRAEEYFSTLTHTGDKPSRPRAFGGFSFQGEYEPKPPWTGYPPASFVVPRVQVLRTDEGTYLTTIATTETDASRELRQWRETIESMPAMRPSGTGPGVESTRRQTTYEEWTAQVETVQKLIRRGHVEKVVLAQTLEAMLCGPVDVAGTLERLRRRYPSCYRFCVDTGTDETFFGAPPERLVSKRGPQVQTEALAGSVPRGETPEADDNHANRLRKNQTYQHEHELVVDAIRDQLEPLSSSVTVGTQSIRQLATIQHLQTPIEATLESPGHVLDIVEALHPTPAVGGLPPEPAWETICDVETFDRGWYAAPIGWFDAAGDGEFVVAIRSGLVRDESITLFSGNGIVADSHPEDEWDEIQLKFRPILDELR